MSSEQRRAKRINGNLLPVTVILRDGKGGPILAGPINGFINDVSIYGARFTVPQIRIESYHLFYACHDNPSLVIHIEVDNPTDNEDHLSIPVRPVWFDRILHEEDELKPFQVGAEFLIAPENDQIKRLKERLSAQEKPGNGWLNKILRSLKAGGVAESSDE